MKTITISVLEKLHCNLSFEKYPKVFLENYSGKYYFDDSNENISDKLISSHLEILE